MPPSVEDYAGSDQYNSDALASVMRAKQVRLKASMQASWFFCMVWLRVFPENNDIDRFCMVRFRIVPRKWKLCHALRH